MFIRESKTRNKKTGKIYIKHSLIESIRTDRGPRQRVVMTLGRLSLDRSLWKSLAFALESYLNGEQEVEHIDMFALPHDLVEAITFQRVAINSKHKAAIKTNSGEDEKPSKMIQEIDVNTLNAVENRSLGPELVAQNTWELLGYEAILRGCGFNDKEIALAATVIWGRLINPGSDLATWRWLREKSSISDFFEADISRVHKDKVYGIADKLLKHKDTLESKLYQRQSDLFSKGDTLFLFDLTNFYFEGSTEGNELAHRGKSKEKLSQNTLVSLALIVDEHGFPVRSEVFEGNISEPKTLEKVLKECGLLNKPAKGELPFLPVLAMDRGIATKDNIDFIKEKGFPFTVIERADKTKEFRKEFQSLEGFTQIEDSKGQTIHLKQTGSKVLCMSEARAEKEQAMLNKKVKKTSKKLDSLVNSVARWHKNKDESISVSTLGKKKLKKKPETVSEKYHEALGKIKKSCPSFDKLFSYQLDEKEGAFTYQVVDDKETAKLCGAYVIEYDKINGSEEDIWRLYMTLNNVENAFRSMKSDLGTRPVYHHGAERTKAHLFLSILAYHMLRNIEYRYAELGDAKRWSSLRETLSTHQRTRLTWTDSDGQKWFKHHCARPEIKHNDIYFKLKVKNKLAAHVYKA